MTTMKASRLAVATVVAACVVATPASALNRCVGADGKVTYTEFECDVGAKASDVRIHDSAGVGTRNGAAPAGSSASLPRPVLVIPTVVAPVARPAQQAVAAPAKAPLSTNDPAVKADSPR